MKHIEAPAFTRTELLHHQLLQYGALGNTWFPGYSRSDYHVNVDHLLDPIAAAACGARSIRHHPEVARRYFKERTYRTVRDGFAQEDAPELRPCLLFLGEDDPEDKPYHRQSTSERLRRRNYVAGRPVFLRAENYRPFMKVGEEHNSCRTIWGRSPDAFPVLVARLDDLERSLEGMLYLEVIGPAGVAYEETEDEESDHLTFSRRNDFQRSLPFPFWQNHIIVPMRDVVLSPELRGEKAFQQPALMPGETSEGDDQIGA